MRLLHFIKLVFFVAPINESTTMIRGLKRLRGGLKPQTATGFTRTLCCPTAAPPLRDSRPKQYMVSGPLWLSSCGVLGRVIQRGMRASQRCASRVSPPAAIGAEVSRFGDFPRAFRGIIQGGSVKQMKLCLWSACLYALLVYATGRTCVCLFQSSPIPSWASRHQNAVAM